MNIQFQEKPSEGLNQFVCQYCGNDFISSIRKLTCSKNCSARYVSKQNSIQKKIIKCEVCNSEFEVSRSSCKKICDDCKKKEIETSYRDIPPRGCEVCGKEFSYDWRKDIGSRKESELRFCSESCSKTFSSKSQDFKKLKSDKCISCGKEILIKNNTSFGITLCDDCKLEKKIIKIRDNEGKAEAQEKVLKENLALIKREKPLKSLKKEKVLFVNCKYCNREISPSNIEKHERACDRNPNSIHIKRNKKRKDCREGYIYLTENLLNGKKYVGKHVGKPESSKKYLGSGIHLLRALKKYGKENFKKTIIEYIEDGDLNEREIYWIKQYKTYENGYNMTEGGDGNRGMLSGRHWFTNGKINVLKYECPEGFYRGITPKK